MKPYILLAVLLSGCAMGGDKEFMRAASASINGGWVDAGSGQVMMARGVQTPTVHPFFGTPVSRR